MEIKGVVDVTNVLAIGPRIRKDAYFVKFSQSAGVDVYSAIHPAVKSSSDYVIVNGKTVAVVLVSGSSPINGADRVYSFANRTAVQWPAAYQVKRYEIAAGLRSWNAKHVSSVETGSSAPNLSGGYVIATWKDNVLVFGSVPKIHASEQSARTEVERLANLNPGVQFVTLRCHSVTQSSGITTKKL